MRVNLMYCMYEEVACALTQSVHNMAGSGHGTRNII
jgi:hypothetical protein